MRPRRLMMSLMAAATLAGAARSAVAVPTQEEVFRSIEQNVDSTPDDGSPSNKPMLFLCIGGGVVILLAIFSQRQKREAVPRAINHQGKLIKEVARGLGVRPREMKQLKSLADQTMLPGGGTVSSPLTLMLCPSQLAKAAQNPRIKADRRVLQQVLRKMNQTSLVQKPNSGGKKRSA